MRPNRNRRQPSVTWPRGRPGPGRPVPRSPRGVPRAGRTPRSRRRARPTSSATTAAARRSRRADRTCWPNDELRWTYAASRPVADMLSSTATPAPRASQERAGWRRRGAWSSTAAIASTSSAVPTGQRAIRTRPAPRRPTSRTRPTSPRRTRRRPPAAGSRPDRCRQHGGQHGGPAVLRGAPAGPAGSRRSGCCPARPGPWPPSSTPGPAAVRARAPARPRSRCRRGRPRSPARPRRRRRARRASIVRATTRAGRSSSMSAASPVSASRNGSTARQVCSASARLLVNPSPYRNRRKESTDDPAQAEAGGRGATRPRRRARRRPSRP